MRNKILSISLVLLLMLGISTNLRAVSGTATVPLNVQVNGTLLITDANNDTVTGKDPTLNVSLNVTPDLGQTSVSGGANFRIRTNKAAWRLTALRTMSSAGGTGLVDADVSVDIATSPGSTANANSATLVAPFNNSTDLSSIPTARPANVLNGTAKTSRTKDALNTNNFYQVNTTYGVAPDFFYQEGTFSTTITYNLVSP